METHWEVNEMGQKLSWLEHTTDNREVDGSSPFWPTTSLKVDSLQLTIDSYEEENCPLSTINCPLNPIWGVSSAGSAPALQAGGHRFDPGTLHHK